MVESESFREVATNIAPSESRTAATGGLPWDNPDSDPLDDIRRFVEQAKNMPYTRHPYIIPPWFARKYPAETAEAVATGGYVVALSLSDLEA